MKQAKNHYLGFDITSTEEAIKIFRSPIPYQPKVNLLPIFPHKHKDTQEQFGRRAHQRLIEIPNPNSEDSCNLKSLSRCPESWVGDRPGISGACSINKYAATSALTKCGVPKNRLRYRKLLIALIMHQF
ncbi:10835_t:CDS:2 [Ambispora gerdemannii]|uniref:10835_t:CDS:1 n=1 Tax=Ambispora gerdemannii TaxID=144530 RepID=A0A9N9D2D9_9GLOM|nr:10835_t:CDS:2 [Ambispora gerdemannii]